MEKVDIFKVLLEREYYLSELDESVENATDEEIEKVIKELENLIQDIREVK